MSPEPDEIIPADGDAVERRDRGADERPHAAKGNGNEPVHTDAMPMESREDVMGVMSKAMAAMAMDVLHESTDADSVGVMYDGDRMVVAQQGGDPAPALGEASTREMPAGDEGEDIASALEDEL